MSLEFFDCNCSIGATNITNPGSFDSPEELISRMNDYKISDAMVYHAVSRDHVPLEGNPLINIITDRYDNLHPVWVVMPHHTGEFPEPTDLLKSMKKGGISAVRIFPSPAKHNFSMKKYSCGSLLDMLEAYRVPLFVDIDEIGWDSIDILLKTYRNLPIILCNTGYRNDRYIYPLMLTYRNLYIETSRFLSHTGLESICNYIGSERILFGTSMPTYTGAGAVFYISNLMLPDVDKKNIASGNLKRLLGEVRL